MGTASDHIGCRKALIICLAILMVSLFVLIRAKAAGMLFLFATIYGFGHGGIFTVVSPLVAERFGTGAHGILFGIILFCGTMGGALGPLLAGWVFDSTGSYGTFFSVLTGFIFLSLVLILRLPSSNFSDSVR